jgi:ABC-2 type transport system permease protein
MVMRRVVAAEWTKLLGLRSPIVIGLVTVVGAGLLTFLSANASSGDPGFDPTAGLLDGMSLAFIGPLVLGVLVGTGEFSTGAFRSTFAAVPRRLPVLAGQAIVTAGFVFLMAVLAAGASALGILPAAASRNITPDLFGDGTPQGLLGAVGFHMAMGLLGVAIGALLRRPVPALVTAIVLMLILPLVAVLAADLTTDPLEASRSGTVSAQTAAVNTVVTFTPIGAGSSLMVPGPFAEGGPDLGSWGALLVLAAWVALPLASAAFRLRRRDLV